MSRSAILLVASVALAGCVLTPTSRPTCSPAFGTPDRQALLVSADTLPLAELLQAAERVELPRERCWYVHTDSGDIAVTPILDGPLVRFRVVRGKWLAENIGVQLD